LFSKINSGKFFYRKRNGKIIKDKGRDYFAKDEEFMDLKDLFS
jgi:hypothetical protein